MVAPGHRNSCHSPHWGQVITWKPVVWEAANPARALNSHTPCQSTIRRRTARPTAQTPAETPIRVSDWIKRIGGSERLKGAAFFDSFLVSQVGLRPQARPGWVTAFRSTPSTGYRTLLRISTFTAWTSCKRMTEKATGAFTITFTVTFATTVLILWEENSHLLTCSYHWYFGRAHEGTPKAIRRWGYLIILHSDTAFFSRVVCFDEHKFCLAVGLRDWGQLTSRARTTREQTLSTTLRIGSSWWGERSWRVSGLKKSRDRRSSMVRASHVTLFCNSFSPFVKEYKLFHLSVLTQCKTTLVVNDVMSRTEKRETHDSRWVASHRRHSTIMLSCANDPPSSMNILHCVCRAVLYRACTCKDAEGSGPRFLPEALQRGHPAPCWYQEHLHQPGWDSTAAWYADSNRI